MAAKKGDTKEVKWKKGDKSNMVKKGGDKRKVVREGWLKKESCESEGHRGSEVFRLYLYARYFKNDIYFNRGLKWGEISHGMEYL